jgi:hypothetical protein
VVQRDRLIGRACPAGAVTDQDDGAGRHQGLDGGQDLCRGDRIQVRGGLIEQQQRRVPQEGAGQRDPLPLPRRQPRCAFTQRGGIPTRQRLDELRCTSQGGGPLDRFAARRRLAERDVLGRRASEQVRPLRPPGDLGPL